MLHKLSMSRSANNRFGVFGVRALVLTPTRELAAQVAENFEKYGKNHDLKMALLIGGVQMGYQVKALSEAGRWVIAPDQRGYGLTKGPAEVEAYDLEHLCGDLVALMDHLGIPKAVFCGHDWGGFVVWYMAIRHPDRVASRLAAPRPIAPRTRRRREVGSPRRTGTGAEA
jgi:pimeloyl-ACP methyl ester carboxylesterase